MNKITTEIEIGKFVISSVVGSNDEIENGVSVFVKHNDEIVFCDNFGDNLQSAKDYVKRNNKGKIKVVDGEFYSK